MGTKSTPVSIAPIKAPVWSALSIVPAVAPSSPFLKKYSLLDIGNSMPVSTPVITTRIINTPSAVCPLRSGKSCCRPCAKSSNKVSHLAAPPCVTSTAPTGAKDTTNSVSPFMGERTCLAPSAPLLSSASHNPDVPPSFAKTARKNNLLPFSNTLKKFMPSLIYPPRGVPCDHRNTSQHTE